MKASLSRVPHPPSAPAVLYWSGQEYQWVRLRVAGSVLTVQADGLPLRFDAPTGGPPSAHAPTHKSGGSDDILLHELGAPTAAVGFAQQEALELVIENRTSDPGSPVEGQIWLRTDL